LANDIITAGAHNGTHVDAPFHYGKYSEGKEAKTIDEVPLEWCHRNGVVLDMKHKEPGSEITISDLDESLKKIGYKIKNRRYSAYKYWMR